MTPGQRLYDTIASALVVGCPSLPGRWSDVPESHAAYESAAAKLSQVPETWPSGWEEDVYGWMVFGSPTILNRPRLPKNADGRRAAWAAAGHPVLSVPSREVLAKALYDCWFDAYEGTTHKWEALHENTQRPWIRIADEALRLLTSASTETTGPDANEQVLDRISDEVFGWAYGWPHGIQRLERNARAAEKVAESMSSRTEPGEGLTVELCIHAMLHRLRTLEEERLELQTERDKALDDERLAAGELLIPIPQPGTDLARVLAANSILRRELRVAEEARVLAIQERDRARGSRADVSLDRDKWKLSYDRMFTAMYAERRAKEAALATVQRLEQKLAESPLSRVKRALKKVLQ
jgi:hypothetical protein